MRGRALTAAFAALALATTLAACRGKSLDQVLEARRAPVEAKLAAIGRLGPAVEAAPRPAPPLRRPDGALVLEPDVKSTAAVVYAQDLADPGALTPGVTRTLRANRLAECGSLLRKKKHLTTLSDPLPRVADEYLEACAAVRWALVVRTFAYEAPRLTGADRFAPGRFDGDVLVFDVTTGELLGGFPVSVRSSNSVAVVQSARDSDRIQNDFEANVFVALDDAIRAALPGALRPPR